MNRGAWWATVHRVAELDMTEQLTLSLVEFQNRCEKLDQVCILTIQCSILSSVNKCKMTQDSAHVSGLKEVSLKKSINNIGHFLVEFRLSWWSKPRTNAFSSDHRLQWWDRVVCPSALLHLHFFSAPVPSTEQMRIASQRWSFCKSRWGSEAALFLIQSLPPQKRKLGEVVKHSFPCFLFVIGV